MNYLRRSFSVLISFGILIGITSLNIPAAQADEIDVSYLQTCLKEEGSSLDVLVLMDSSASLRNSTPSDPWYNDLELRVGSDPDQKRGKILKSSLKLLRGLAEESNRDFNINLRTFGNNSEPKELKKLLENSVDWTDKTTDSDLANFVEKALYDDSDETDWTGGLASAKQQFKERIGKATLEGNKSCPVMFWITDGAATSPTAPICTPNTDSSIDWFRENNVLILGGLLEPRNPQKRKEAQNFRPIVTGENCGNNKEGWTKGEVIAAQDIGDLAWGFVGLIASIKNLINLDGENSSFFADPGTSHIEIFIKGNPQGWEIKGPDGVVICTSNNQGDQCKVSYDSEIAITTVTIYPKNPIKSSGKWTINPSISSGNFKVFGSLNTSSRGINEQPRLEITSPFLNTEIEEGETARFRARIVNPDGTDFSISGFKSVTICAKVNSAEFNNCKNGSNIAELDVTPIETDKSVAFEAILTSAYDSERNYRIAASKRINVIPSGAFPSLVCDNQTKECNFKNLKNKMAKSVNTLTVLPAKNGSSEGKVSLLSFTILSDNNKNRGDGHFSFNAEKSNGEALIWPSENQFLVPGEKIQLTITTDLAGDSKIQGVMKYKVYSDGKEIIRQQNFQFSVKNDSNLLTQILLLLITYLITIGIPYLYLLWAARRSAVLNVPDGEFSYLVLPFEISKDGKVSETNSNNAERSFTPDYKNLTKIAIDPTDREVTIDKVKVMVVPPKWNPFNSPITLAKLPGHYIFSTLGQKSFEFEESQFNSSLHNEVLMYFAADGNITATSTSQEEIVESTDGLDFLGSAYESKLTEINSAPSIPVSGNAIFIVSPYMNREKSLSELVSKLNAALSGADFKSDIEALRKASLEQLLAKREIEKQMLEKEAAKSEKKKPKSGEKNGAEQSVVDSSDDEWGGSSRSNRNSNDLPGSQKEDDSW